MLCALQLSEVRLPLQELEALFTLLDSQSGQVVRTVIGVRCAEIHQQQETLGELSEQCWL